jgi:hypothetical protein
MASQKPVRRAQLISPFGIGAMVDFPGDESLMTAGLDAWPFAFETCPKDWLIIEERLQRRLGVNHFRLPPDFRTGEEDPDYNKKNVPYVRFPQWHFCPDRACGRLHKRSIFDSGISQCRDAKHKNLPDRQVPRLVPVRFVAVCPKGHIEDFPFMEWAHRGQSVSSEEHTLFYKAGRSAALSGITIQCSCGERRNMGGAFSYSNEHGGALSAIGHNCKGLQPWLGTTESDDNCVEHLRAVQKGGSNVYFPTTYSSIYLPLWAEGNTSKVIKVLEDPKIWGVLTSGLDQGKYIQPEKCETIAAMRGVDAEKLRVAAQDKYDGIDVQVGESEEAYRFSEYEAFKSERGSAASDLLVNYRSIFDYDKSIQPYFESICLIPKLKETRVLSGFTRLLPNEGENTSSQLQPLNRSKSIDWLPAMEVRGEGIFIEFNKEKLDSWGTLKEVSSRTNNLSDHINSSRLQRGLAHELISPKLVLIHTFAHILIRQLSYDCGYGSASLRERIYCNADDENEMHGLLIYTAAGDSEGTMGGLVRMGEPGYLENIINSALRNAQWCSSDPVCMESTGQGTDNANLAACHGCVLLPETSCEKGNKLLDRAMIINSPPNHYFGYFDC